MTLENMQLRMITLELSVILRTEEDGVLTEGEEKKQRPFFTGPWF